MNNGLPPAVRVLRTLMLVGGTTALVSLVTSLDAQTTSPAPAAAPAALATDSEVIELQAFVSVGSRFAERTATESMVPIDIVSAADLTAGGYTETSQMLQSLVPSFNFPRATIGDGTDHIRPATLRGLAPDQVLVLVNGKRRHTSSLVNVNGTIGRGSVSVDLNSIPSAAIGRIEVLRDGASAQYGSDAIAGVINIVLDKSLGSGLNATYGVTSEDDGQVVEASAFAGVPLAGDGVLRTTLFFRDRERTNRSEADTRMQYFGTNPSTGAQVAISGNYLSGTTLPPAGVTLDPREATINRINHSQGDGDMKDKGVFLDAELPVGSASTTLYAFGGYSQRDGTAAGFFRRAGDDRTVRSIWPNGFLPLINTDIADVSAAVGARSKVADWDVDFSTNYGRNTLEYIITNSNNVTLGAASPTRFYAGKLGFDQWTTNFDLTNGFDIGLRAPLNVALGAEYRWEEYEIGAGEPDSYRDGGVRILDGPSAGAQGAPGAQVFPGFRPSDATRQDRTSYAFYTELANQINERWDVSFAARFEDFSDFGTTTDFKLASRVQISAPVAIRGAVSTGFRAPHLAQQYFSSTATNFIGGVPFENKTFPVTDPVAIALGASPLKPEESTNYSFGVTYQPNEAFTTSVDYYHIAIDDRVILSSNYTGTAVTNFLVSKGITGVTGGRYFTNAVDTETEGVDVSVRYVQQLGEQHKVTYTAGFNYNKTEVTRFSPTPPVLAALGITTPLFDLTEQVRLESGQPKTNFNFTLGYELRKFGLQLRTVRYGEVESVALPSASLTQIVTLTPGFETRLAPTVPASTNQQVIQNFGEKWITDLDLSYQVTERIRVSAGINNLGNVYPEKNLASVAAGSSAVNGTDNVGIFPYNGISPFGFNGAFYYTKLSLKF
ncbi:MAG TPA: TonB-dependent receptor [Opitutaceae bacterium]